MNHRTFAFVFAYKGVTEASARGGGTGTQGPPERPAAAAGRVDVLADNREQRTEKRQVRTEKGSR